MAEEKGYRLRVVRGPDAGAELLILDPEEGPVSIGRDVDPNMDLLCTDSKVSRKHATIRYENATYTITDHGSTNRTRVNGRLLKPEVPEPLNDGDEILLGPDTAITFETARPRPTSQPLETRPPRYEFDGFAIYDALSKGDVDRVDVALQKSTRQRVALKRFAKELARPVVRRLLDQAARAKNWKHPNIAHVIDFGEFEGIPYVASRLVDGLVLAEIQERAAQDVTWQMAAYIVRECSAALAYVQEQDPQFVHRNINPRSIMIDYTGEVLMINFGFTPVEALRVGTVKLHPKRAYYLAPEHRAQRSLEPRSDIFSLGIVLYELLNREFLDPRRIGFLPEIDIVRPDIPARLARIATRAMAMHADQRFQTAKELCAELTQVLDIEAPHFGPTEAAQWMIRMRFGVWR